MSALEPHNKHSPDTIDKAFLCLAIEGSQNKAVDRLREEHGIEITQPTLSKWRKQHASRFAQIYTEQRKAFDDEFIARFKDNTLASLELSRLATEQAIQDGTAHGFKNPSQVAKEAAVTAGLGLNSALTLEGRPTAITEHRHVEDILSNLERVLGLETHDIPEADVIESAE